MQDFLTPQLINFLLITVLFLCAFSAVKKLYVRLSQSLLNDNKEQFITALQSITHYVFVIIYFLYVLNFLIDVRILGALVGITAISFICIFHKPLNCFFLGYYRLSSNIIVKDEIYIFNNDYRGKVESISLHNVVLVTNHNSHITLSHNDIFVVEKLKNS